MSRRNYERVLQIVQTMIEGFNPDFYKNQPWGIHVAEVLEDFKGLENALQNLS